jgi:hypothetical protein
MQRASVKRPDFGLHIERALGFPHETGGVVHVLFHAVFLSVHHIAPTVAQTDAALVAILVFMLPVPLMVFALLRKAAGGTLPTAVLIALSLALTILAPITIWFNRFMIGYINPIVYHNPTSIAAQLFVIPLSLLAFRIFQGQSYHNLNARVHAVLLSASVLLLGTLAKPSFTVILLPGLGLFALWRVCRRQRIDWILLLCGFCLPGFLLMGLQYLLAFGNQDSSAIAVGFLTFMLHWVPAWRIPIQLLLSLAFPLAVFALYFTQARRDLYLNLCWVIFAVGAASVYFLYEDSARIAHGNFIWGSYNAIFLLMFASLRFLVVQHARETRGGSSDFTLFGVGFSRRVAIAALFFGLHLHSGLAYYDRFIG